MEVTVTTVPVPPVTYYYRLLIIPRINHWSLGWSKQIVVEII